MIFRGGDKSCRGNRLEESVSESADLSGKVGYYYGGEELGCGLHFWGGDLPLCAKKKSSERIGKQQKDRAGVIHHLKNELGRGCRPEK